MKSLIKVSVLIAITIYAVFGGWGQKPKYWDDFEMGVLSISGDVDNLLSIAIDSIVPDRRYFWVTNVNDISSFMFTSFANYSKKDPFFSKGLKPSIVISMLQNGGDGISDIRTQAADSAFMYSYFNALVHMADSSKGSNPIYIIEPDVWGYILQSDNGNLGAVELERECYINNLGFAWLSEFDNKLIDLPNAIIKTLKQADPGCFAGIEIPHWAYHPQGMSGANLTFSDSSDVKKGADSTSSFVNYFLGSSNRGDFIAVGKQMYPSGYWETNASNFNYSWNLSNNEKWLYWSELVGQTTNLPLFAYNISAGYVDESGYPALANTANKYEDSFLQYFFNFKDDFIDAGFIGLLAGTPAGGGGTYLEWGKGGTGDNGYFYDNLEVFNAGKPYLQRILNPSGITCIDLDNNSYNIDQLLNQGKHIICHQSFTSEPVLSTFAKTLDTIYNDYGKNQDNTVVLFLGISNADDSTALFNKLTEHLGKNPSFPIIQYANGANSLATLFGKEYYSNTSWILHPDRDYVEISGSSTTNFKSVIDAALSDDCILPDVTNLTSEFETSETITINWDLPAGEIGKIFVLIDTLPDISLEDSGSVLLYNKDLSVSSTSISFNGAPHSTNYYVKVFLQNSDGIVNSGTSIYTQPYVINPEKNLLKVLGWELALLDGGDQIDTTGGLIKGDTLTVGYTFDNNTPNIGQLKSKPIVFGSTEQSLSESEYVKITYRSDTATSLILASDIVSYLYPYQVALPATNGMWVTDSIVLDTTEFKQPSGTPVGDQENLLLSTVQTVWFSSSAQSKSITFDLAYIEIDGFTSTLDNVSNFNSVQQTKGGDSVDIKLDWIPSKSLIGDSLLIQWSLDPNATLNDATVIDSVFVQRNITSRTIRVENRDTSYIFMIGMKKGSTNYTTPLKDTVAIENSAPSDISLSSSSINEGINNGVVGILSTIDPDTADSGNHSYEIVFGSSNFSLSGKDTIITSQALAAGFLGLKIKTTDIFGSSFTDSFTVEVLDTTTPRFYLTINDASGSITNPKIEGDTVSIVAAKKADSLNAEFSFLKWSGDTTYLTSINAESTSVVMPAESVDVTANYHITNYKPTDINISSSSIDGDVDSGTFFAILSTVDEDIVDTYTYVLNEGNQYFLISNDSIFTFSGFDSTLYGTDITIKITSSDLKGSSIQDSFNIRINDPNGPSAFLTVNNGNDTTTNKYTVGDEVDVVAYDGFIDKVFKSWIGNVEAIITGGNLSKEISVKIPDSNITLTATYDTTYLLSVSHGSGTGRYTEGSQVEISAIDSLPFGRAFDKWVGDTASLDSSLKSTATVTIPSSNVELIATFKDDVDSTYQLTVNGGSGSGSYKKDTTISIVAIDSSAFNRLFDKWIGDIEHLDNSLSANAIVTMPNSDIELTATYRDAGVTTYQLVVNGGLGSGNYIEDTTITIIAFDSSSSGRVFVQWQGDTEYLNDSLNDTAIVAMPASDITINALYKDVSVDSTLLDIILADSVINATDFTQISKHWNYSANNYKDSLLELSPYSGELPNITIVGDSIFDYKDLSAFAALSYHYPDDRNFNTSRAKSIISADAVHSGKNISVDINIENVEDLVSCYIKIISTNEILLKDLNPNGLLAKNDGQVFKFVRNNNNEILTYLTRLSADNLSVDGYGKLVSTVIEGNVEDLIIEYELINSKCEVIESGVYMAEVRNDNKKGVLLSVAPNPSKPNLEQKQVLFNKMISSSGGFNFVIDNLYSVGPFPNIELKIIDNLGDIIANEKMVVNSEYATFYWNGCNKNNRPVTSGIYEVFVTIRSGDNKIVIRRTVGVKE